MNEGNRFVVEIIGQLQEAREVTVSRVCEALGLDETRAAALVARMPGIITRPASEDRAMKIALRLQQAGVPALHRPLAEGEDPFQSRGAAAAVVVGRPKVAPELAPPPPIESAHAIDPRPVAAPSTEVAEAVETAAVEAADAPPEAARPVAATEVAAEPAVHESDPDLPAFDVDDAPVPSDIPSFDVTHHDVEFDPKLTPMSEAGFGAADIMLPTKTTAERPRPRSTFVEAGPTSIPTLEIEDPVQTMVRAPSETPTPHPDLPPATGRAVSPLSGRADGPVASRSAKPQERPLTPVAPALTLSGGDHGVAPVPKPAAAAGGAPLYRQTRSSAEPALTLSAPPEDVLKRTGIPDSELDSERKRRRGRFGRHLAAQVALPGLLTWSLTAVALWWFLGSEQSDLFIVLAAATALAALMGSLLAALGTMGLAQDVIRLRDEARRVAMGDLTAPVASNREDELGEIAGSLERMRLSLQEGMERLRRRR